MLQRVPWLSALSREQAIATALERHYGIRVARLNQDLAEVGDDWGAAGALPQVGVSLGTSASVNDQTDNPSTFLPIATQSQAIAPAAQLQWTLFDGMGMFAAKDRLGLVALAGRGQCGTPCGVYSSGGHERIRCAVGTAKERRGIARSFGLDPTAVKAD